MKQDKQPGEKILSVRLRRVLVVEINISERGIAGEMKYRIVSSEFHLLASPINGDIGLKGWPYW
jgi:hypothetical protein